MFSSSGRSCCMLALHGQKNFTAAFSHLLAVDTELFLMV